MKKLFWLIATPLAASLFITFFVHQFTILEVWQLSLVLILIYLIILAGLLIQTNYAKRLFIALSYLSKTNLKNITREEYDQKKFILENISEGICAVNHQGEVVFYNQKFFKKFIKPWKLAQDQVPTIDIIFDNHEDLKQAFYRVIRLQTNESIRQIMHQHRERDLFFDITISGIEKDEQNFAAAVGVFHDVTEKRLTDMMRANFVGNTQ